MNTAIRKNPLVRIVIGILFLLLVPVAAKILVLSPLFGFLDLDEPISKGIQGVITIGIILAAYQIFYKKMEQRQISELAGKYFFRESVTGFAMGFTLIALITGFLYLLGYYTPVAVNPVSVLFKPIVIFCVMGVREDSDANDPIKLSWALGWGRFDTKYGGAFFHTGPGKTFITTAGSRSPFLI